MRKFLFSSVGILLLTGTVLISACTESKAELPPIDITVYKSATCGCCSGWIDHLKANEFNVKVETLSDVTPIKRQNGVANSLWSCHTALVGGYVIEGHVPAADVRKLLLERPDIAGLSVPGMVQGSPGMDGPNPKHYNVIAFSKDGKTSVYARH